MSITAKEYTKTKNRGISIMVSGKWASSKVKGNRKSKA